ncbi:hypothetical protein O3M35_000643 [Rhynocoris fuscipes]|uniref:Ionotropic glutamate receptor C-terminal domain-containing protein n=1 Tax=Rhynocoris fuscipes TaxID=488301 RepID=A0AAW1DT55_9HEMI
MELKLLRTFCELRNCTIVKVTDEYQWGEIWKNMSGNGVVGNVFMDKADIGTGAIYLWYNEYKHLDFTYPYLQSKVTVLVPKPHQLPEWRIPINAFSLVLWISLLISLTFIIITLYLVNKYTNKITAYYSKEMVLEEFSTLSGVILRVVGMALLQAPPVRLRTGSTLQRFFTLSEILFLLFTTIYSGALSSILTIPAYYPPIDHPKDLYKSGIPWAATHNAWIYSLQEAAEPYLSGLINRFEVHDTETLKKLAKKGGYGFCIEIMAGGHVTQQDHLSGEMIYGLHVMKNELYFTPSVTVLRKGSSYTKELTRLIHNCLDAGLMMLWEGTAALKYLSSRLQTALEQSETSSHEFKKRPIKLKLKHLQGAFIALGLGLSIATLIFIYEKFSSFLNKKTQIKQDSNNWFVY